MHYGSALPPPNTFEISQNQQTQTTQYGMGQETQYSASQAEAESGTQTNSRKPYISSSYFKPYRTKCPHCGTDIKTKATYHAGKYTESTVQIYRILLIVVCMCCLAQLLCRCNWNKDVTHTCPRCHRVVAEYERTQDETTIME